MGRIAILVHKNGSLEDPPYVLGGVAEVWREDGWQISVLRGPDTAASADLAILHVDMTAIPDAYLDCLKHVPKVLNGRVTDISKRRISEQLVRPRDRYDGPVIVKTTRNSGGDLEAQLSAGTTRLQRFKLALRYKLPWTVGGCLKTSDYKVFSSVRDVPPIVWLNPRLIVERFLPEMRDGFYCLRTWVFLGDRETNSLSYSKHPVVKSDNVVRREVVEHVPEQLRDVRRRMGFDFGKFDYAIVDGHVVLYDTNRTPTLGAIPREQYLQRMRYLAEGLKAYL